MSYSVSTDIAKFIAKYIFEGSVPHSKEKNDLDLIIAPETYLLGEFEWQADPPEEKEIIVNGWKWCHSGIKKPFTKHGRVSGDRWQKNDTVVYTVNESQYSNVGEVELSVIGLCEEDIKLFCNDNNLTMPLPIEADETVSWWC